MQCGTCGKQLPLIGGKVQPDPYSPVRICLACDEQVRLRRQQGQGVKQELKEQEEQERQLREQATSVVVTTTPSLDGYIIQKYLGIESVEFVIGTGPISELVSGVQDFFGARSSPFEEKLRAAKETAFETLKIRAVEKGGNAVVGVDLDYIDFSGNRIGLIVNGTVVSAVRASSTTNVRGTAATDAD